MMTHIMLVGTWLEPRPYNTLYQIIKVDTEWYLDEKSPETEVSGHILSLFGAENQIITKEIVSVLSI